MTFIHRDIVYILQYTIRIYTHTHIYVCLERKNLVTLKMYFKRVDIAF